MTNNIEDSFVNVLRIVFEKTTLSLIYSLGEISYAVNFFVVRCDLLLKSYHLFTLSFCIGFQRVGLLGLVIQVLLIFTRVLRFNLLYFDYC